MCVNLSCKEWGAEALLEAFKSRLADTSVQVKTHICFGFCWGGPNVLLYPDGTMYSNVQLADVDDIVAHIRGGKPADRLVNRTEPQLLELTLSLLAAGLEE